MIDPEASPDDQRYQALTAAHGREWLTFVHVTPGSFATRRYVILLPDGRARRLPPAAVLPYVTGLADGHGEPDLIPEPPESEAP